MSIIEQEINYQHENVILSTYQAWDSELASSSAKGLPGVLISHDAMGGGTDFEKGRAQALAALGYVGFTLDVYGADEAGNKQRASGSKEAYSLMRPFAEDRLLLRARLAVGLAKLAEQPQVDASRIAVIGYCFGGMCALEMARANLPIKAAASFHGSLSADSSLAAEAITAKILVLHGWSDPIVPEAEVSKFAAEMTERNADWQFIAYGGAMHSFTNPLANMPENGVQYSADVDRRSWQALASFLNEVFTG